VKLLKRTFTLLLWTVGIVFLLLVLAWAFHSPIVRWTVKKYSPEYTGRQITLDQFHLNPLNGQVSMGGLKIMEASGESTFLTVDHIVVNATLYKMLGGAYEITALHLTHPVVRIVQHGERFNFSDVIERFTSDATEVDTTTSEPVQYALLDLRVDSADISYLSDLLPQPLHIVEASVACPQVKSDVPLIEALVKALGSDGTDLTAEIGFDLERMIYRGHVQLANVPLKMTEPYVQPYFRIGGFAGTLSTDLFLRGNANDPMDVSLKGRMGVAGFAMNDPNGVKLISLKALDLAIDTVDVKKEVYRVRRFVLEEPYVFSELYDEGDNFTKWMPVDSTAADSTEEALGYDPMNPFSMLAYYVKLVAENYSSMNYKVDSLGVVNGTVLFNDFTLVQPFHYSLTDLSLAADDINSTAKEILVRAHSVLNTDGTFDAELALDPNTLRNMRLSYTAEGVGMPAFGPYTVHYVAHPILSGRTRYVCSTTVLDNKLHSENHILVEDFAFGKKMQIADAMQLPVRLAVSLMKDKNGNIDLKVPVEGDLDDPEYRVWPIVWQVVKNLLVKVVSAPGQMLARTFDADEDDLRAVYFLYLQGELTSKQEKPLNILMRVAKEKPELRIELVQAGDMNGEAEAYAIRIAKAAYYVDSTGTPIDSSATDLDALLKDIDIKGAGFRAWINGKVGAADEPVQRTCMRLVGAENATAEVARLWAMRRASVTTYLQRDTELPAGAITVRDRAETDTIPALGQPAFHMLYGAGEGEAVSVTPP
jgi:Domain of Unknown Function (DUF748)